MINLLIVKREAVVAATALPKINNQLT